MIKRELRAPTAGVAPGGGAGSTDDTARLSSDARLCELYDQRRPLTQKLRIIEAEIDSLELAEAERESESHRESHRETMRKLAAFMAKLYLMMDSPLWSERAAPFVAGLLASEARNE
jgi:hypothetical protein